MKQIRVFRLLFVFTLLLELTLGAVESPSAALARNPSIKTIEKIAQAPQVPVVKLFEDRRPENGMIQVW